jgi:membrane-associated protease RseP (regulator of RpoE activity)
MDFTTFLTVAVALLIVLSGYLLFNDVPRFGRPSPRRPR